MTSKSVLKILCAHGPIGMAEKMAKMQSEIAQLREREMVLVAELLRVKEICLREVGIGIVNENVLNQAQTAESDIARLTRQT